MDIKTSTGPFVLFLGDLCFLTIALWVTLFLRYLNLPSADLFYSHFWAFIFIFFIWILVYFIYDLYSNQTSLLQKKLDNLLFNAHIVNSIIALAFFYFIPYFQITPKTNLFIFLLVSFLIIFLWRKHLVFFLGSREEEKILFACTAPEVEELKEEFSNNNLYNMEILHRDNISDEEIKNVSPIIVINTHDANITGSLLDFYKMIFSGVRFVSIDSLYESVFNRIPVSLISERWFLESLSLTKKPAYDVFKRLMDILVALPLGLMSLVFYPFIYLAIKSDDGGEVFITPERVGQNNKSITLYKFRTMEIGNDAGNWGKASNKVTRVGQFLRRSRLDELPQLWNVVKGDMSLIGPRPEFKAVVEKYNEEIKYYNIRHLIKPGLSGWAQIRQSDEPHHGFNVSSTSIKLSYDLYYIKNRSVFLDIKIALKTIRILLARSGVSL